MTHEMAGGEPPETTEGGEPIVEPLVEATPLDVQPEIQERVLPLSEHAIPRQLGRDAVVRAMPPFGR